MIIYSDYLGVPVYIVHISTSKGADLVRKAQLRGGRIFAETCPHYLILNAGVIKKHGEDGTKFICNPPLRSANDQAELWKAVANNQIQVISLSPTIVLTIISVKRVGEGEF